MTFLWKGAEWMERETYDMFGIIFEGNRDLRRIYMPPDYTSFPLRKDFYLPDDAARSPGGGVRHMERTHEPVDAPPATRAPARGPSDGPETDDHDRATPGTHRSADDPNVLLEDDFASYEPIPPYPPRTEREAEFYTLGDGEMFLNMGPQHPSTHGVLRVVLKLDGERVVDIDPVLGYLHRGVEKLIENARLPPDDQPAGPARVHLVPLLRVGARSWPTRSCSTSEVPRRAEYIRVLSGELNRIASHALFMGWFALDLGGLTPILWSFIERDEIVEMLAALTGARMLFNYFRIGGVNGDLNHEFMSRLGDWMSRAVGQIEAEHTASSTRTRSSSAARSGLGVVDTRDGAAVSA